MVLRAIDTLISAEVIFTTLECKQAVNANRSRANEESETKHKKKNTVTESDDNSPVSGRTVLKHSYIHICEQHAATHTHFYGGI